MVRQRDEEPKDGFEKLKPRLLKKLDHAYHDVSVFKEIGDYLARNISAEQAKRMAGILECVKPDFAERRESFTANELRRIRPNMHIGGREHIFGGFDILPVTPLYERVVDLTTERILLCDAFNYINGDFG